MTTTTSRTTDLDTLAGHLVDIGRTWTHPAPATAEQTRQRLHWAAEDLLDLLDGTCRLGTVELTHPWTHGGQSIGGDLRRMFVNGYPKGTGIDQQLFLASMFELIHDHAGPTGPDPFAMGAFLTGFCRLLADGHNGISYRLVLVEVDEHGQTVRRGEDLAPALPDVFAAAWARWMHQTGHRTTAESEPTGDDGSSTRPAGRTPQQRRARAEHSRSQVRHAIAMTMPDPDLWDDGTGRPDLIGYLNHLTTAVRGHCDHCDRPIYAPHTVTPLPAHPVWHRGRWRQALRELGRGLATAWHTLRYGDVRIAHTSCRPPRHWS